MSKNLFIAFVFAAAAAFCVQNATAQASRILFISDRDGNSEIYAMNPNGSYQTRLTNNAASDYGARFNADSSKIVFTSDRDGNPEIYTMNADGSNQTRLTNNPARDDWKSFSRDGSKIVFVSNRDGNDEIYVMNADGSNQTRLTNNAASDDSASFSPDGTKIVFRSNRDGNTEIYVMNADGTNQRRLTNHTEPDDSPSFSPDGSKIVFSSYTSATYFEIFVMDPDGSFKFQLSTGYGVAPSYSPDGSKIVYQSISGIKVMNANGSNPTLLPNTKYNYDWGAIFSPDSSQIALTSRRDGNDEIYVYQGDLNQTRLTFAAPYADSLSSWGVQPASAALPVLSNAAVTPVSEGSYATLSGNLANPNPGDSFMLTVNWGDGSPAQTFNYAAGTTSFAEMHRYADDNPTATPVDNYTVSLTLYSTGGYVNQTATATVSNVAPSLINLAASPATAPAGTNVTVTGTTSDPGALDWQTIIINWGDGTPNTGADVSWATGGFFYWHTYYAVGNFTITVTAVDDDGGAATSSQIVVNVTMPPPPAAPTNLQITAPVTSTAVKLGWTDNSGNESGFVIERCANKNCTNFAPIKQVSANIRTYTDTKFNAGTSYTYRVRAVNAGGSSAYSNTVSAIIPLR